MSILLKDLLIFFCFFIFSHICLKEVVVVALLIDDVAVGSGGIDKSGRDGGYLLGVVFVVVVVGSGSRSLVVVADDAVVAGCYVVINIFTHLVIKQIRVAGNRFGYFVSKLREWPADQAAWL